MSRYHHISLLYAVQPNFYFDLNIDPIVWLYYQWHSSFLISIVLLLLNLYQMLPIDNLSNLYRYQWLEMWYYHAKLCYHRSRHTTQHVNYDCKRSLSMNHKCAHWIASHFASIEVARRLEIDKSISFKLVDAFIHLIPPFNFVKLEPTPWMVNGYSYTGYSYTIHFLNIHLQFCDIFLRSKLYEWIRVYDSRFWSSTCLNDSNVRFKYGNTCGNVLMMLRRPFS